MSGSLPRGEFRFELEGKIGEGGFGRVDKARVVLSNADGIEVGSYLACKRLNPKWDQNPEARARFEREIVALTSMSHANIVTCEGWNLPESKDRFYFMKLYASNLRQLVATGTQCGDWRLFAHHGAVLADALAHAHQMGFIHRDIKPENILFNHGGSVILADWGLGYFTHKNSKVLQNLTRGRMGTEYYCSLEQWSAGKCDHRGDIYSLGMTIDECITGYQRDITVGMGVNGVTTNETSLGAQHFNTLVRAMTSPFPSGRVATMQAVAAGFRYALAFG